MVKELGDRAAQGRAYGNLGNTHYLLGNFTEATTFHKEVSWAWVLGQESLRSPLTVLNSVAPGEPLSLLLLLYLVLWSCLLPWTLRYQIALGWGGTPDCVPRLWGSVIISGFGSVCSAWPLPRSLETRQLRGGPTATWAMPTSSWGASMWLLNITSEQGRQPWGVLNSRLQRGCSHREDALMEHSQEPSGVATRWSTSGPGLL